MSEVKDWANTAAGNATAYDDIDGRDGRPRAQGKLNNRAMMAATRRMYDSIATANSILVDAYIPSALLTAIRAGTSTVDVSSYVNLAIAAAGNRGKVRFGAGKYMMNVVITNRVTFQGAGMGVTTIWPFSTATAVITHNDAIGSTWQYVEHSDFTLNSTSSTGIGIQIGPTAYVLNSEFVGRYMLRRVSIYDFDRAVERVWGQIGFAAIDCSFAFNNFDFYVRDATRASKIMHGGNMYVLRGEYSFTKLAHLYLDSATNGSGQIIFDSVIHESMPGFVFFIKNWNTVTAAPGLEVRSCWNEANYTAGTVTIDSVSYTPRYLRATNADRLLFTDTPVGPYDLFNSRLFSHRCNIGFITGSTKDASSTAIHRDAYADDLKSREFVASLDGANRAAGGFNVAVRMPHRSGTSKAWPPTFSVDCTATFTTGGSAAVATTSVTTDGATFGTSQNLVVGASDSLTHPTVFTVPAGKHIVIVASAKLISGNGVRISVNGPVTTANLDAWTTVGEWQTMVALVNTVGVSGFPAASSSFFFNPVSGASTIRLGGLALVAFDTEQQAVEFIATGIFPTL
jgi:hypothetical protein